MIVIERLTFAFGSHFASSPDIIFTYNKKITSKYVYVYFSIKIKYFQSQQNYLIYKIKVNNITIYFWHKS